MKLTKTASAVLAVILLAACSAQGSTAPAATESPETTTAAPSPSASPAAEPTETPELTPISAPSPTAPAELVFIVSDEAWAGAKEIIPPDGDWAASGYVFVDPGSKVRSPYDAMVSFHEITFPDGTKSECIFLTARKDKSESWEDITSKSENYPICFTAMDITPSFSQYEMVKEGEVIGTVNSTELGLTPEVYEKYGLYGYNLCISCTLPIQSFGIEEPFADELTLKDKIMFIAELAKEAQAKPTEES